VSRALLERPDAFRIVTFDAESDVPSAFQGWELSAA